LHTVGELAVRRALQSTNLPLCSNGGVIRQQYSLVQRQLSFAQRSLDLSLSECELPELGREHGEFGYTVYFLQRRATALDPDIEVHIGRGRRFVSCQLRDIEVTRSESRLVNERMVEREFALGRERASPSFCFRRECSLTFGQVPSNSEVINLPSICQEV